MQERAHEGTGPHPAHGWAADMHIEIQMCGHAHTCLHMCESSERTQVLT